MNVTLAITVSSIFAGIYLLIGYLASKRVHNTSDYFLAGRSLGILPVAFTLVATQLGGGMIIGTSGEAYQYGMYGIMYTASMSLGFILLAAGIAGALRDLNVATTAEIFEKRYNLPRLKQVASFLSIITLCGVLIGQIVASRGVINEFTGGSETLFFLFWTSIILYTMLGGLHAVVATDIFQVLIIVTVFTGIFVYMLMYEPAGFFSSLGSMQRHFESQSMSFSTMLSIFLMPMLFSFIEQDLAQRFFAARTRKVATLSALVSGIFMIIFALVPIYLGMKAKMMGISIEPNRSLMHMISIITNDLVFILAGCGIIAAITSTADSLLNAISSNLAQDFDFSWTGISMLTLSQILTFSIGTIAFAASYAMPQDVISILSGSYAISVNLLFVPLIIAYFASRVSSWGAIGAVIAGAAGSIACFVYDFGTLGVVLPLMLSAVGYSMGSMTEK